MSYIKEQIKHPEAKLQSGQDRNAMGTYQHYQKAHQQENPRKRQNNRTKKPRGGKN